MRKFLEMTNVQNVVAGSTATAFLETGLTYEKLMLKYTNLTRAQMKNIQVEINGKVVQQFVDGDQLDALNDYYGRSDTAGYLTIYFIRPEGHNLAEQRFTGLGTLGVRNFNLNVDIDAAAVNPAVEIYAALSDATPPNVITKIKRVPFSPGTAGEHNLNNLQLGKQLIAALHFEKSDVSNVRILADGREVYNLPKVMGEVNQKEYGRAPVTGSFTHVDFMLDGEIKDALITGRKRGGSVDPIALQVSPTLTTAGDCHVLVEYLDSLSGI